AAQFVSLFGAGCSLPLLLLALISIAPPCVLARSKFVSVNMFAKWQSTSLLAEASEFLHQQNSELFWQYLDNLAQRNDLSSMTDSAEYQLALSESSRLAPGSRSDLLRLWLSLRAASPALEMNAQLGLNDADRCLKSLDSSGGFAVLPGGGIACTADQLDAELAAANASAPLQLYRTDKVRLESAGVDEQQLPPTVLLYARLASGGFPAWHVAMTTLAKAGKLRYAFRHAPPAELNSLQRRQQRTRLSGYGVELAIKSTEYKAMDDSKVEDSKEDSHRRHDEEDEVQGFLFSKLRALHPNLSQELNQFKQHLLDSSTEIAPLKAWQLQDLSYQAAQRVLTVTVDDSLHVLRDLSQNYPVRAKALSQIAVLPSLRAQLEANQRLFQQQLGLPQGASLLLVNGRPVDLEFYDVFTMLQSLTEEASLMDAATQLGLPASHVASVVLRSLAASSASASDEKFALDFRDPAVVYLNDLEQSQVYAQWPRSVHDLLKPAFPGTMRRIARNLFNLVVFIDPAVKESADLIRYCEAFVQHTVPIRIGLVWAPKDEVGRALVRSFNFVKNDKGSTRSAVSYLTDIYSVTFEQGYSLNLEFAHQYFKGLYPDVDSKDALGDKSSDYEDQLAAGQAFLARSGLASAPAVLLNGGLLDTNAAVTNFEETVLTEIMRQTSELQREVAAGQLKDSQNVVDFINERPNVVKRLNQRLLQGGKTLTQAQLNAVGKLSYFVKNDDSATRAASLWLACDLATAGCRSHAYEALRLVKASAQLRLALLHTGEPGLLLAKALQSAASTVATKSAKHAVNLASKLCKPENWPAVSGINEAAVGNKALKELAVHGMDWDAFAAAADSDQTRRELDKLSKFASTELGTPAAASTAEPPSLALVSNGRLVGPLPQPEVDPADLRLLERLALSRAGRAVAESLDKLSNTELASVGNDRSELSMRLSALLNSHPAAVGSGSGSTSSSGGSTSGSSATRRIAMPDGLQPGGLLKLEPMEPNSARPSLEVTAIVDPLSRDAQKMSHILLVLRQALNARITVAFNCREKLSEPPLKTFYRYLLTAAPVFAKDGSLSSAGSTVNFDGMPSQPILTLGIDTPHNWMAEVVNSPYDLDNIQLAAVSGSGVHAEYELEYLLVEGHCVDSASNQIPRGLQFTLGTVQRPLLRDTIVMYNLGYFQLKAAPNAWQLRLRAGKSADIYDIAAHENTDGETAAGDPVAVLDSFRSKVITVRVAKKPDRLDDSLLGDEPAQQSIWGSISNAFTASPTVSSEDRDQTLNIFSVASGHLYERFLRIMMLSVLKNTKSKVKFWFLKNFLSPSFIKFIPYYAEKYNFEYALVQYKWPRWLNRQTEKQRIIWAYKILFLDVLFPLDVKRIIFVDADQIVRTDMQQLADMDIRGAPYAYTPFCDSRRDMEGFRFWKTGYWANHLGNRPYHISALYLVDLVRFRRLAAGDRLRGQYQGLSQDPNSLANLDQDLPNYMIHQVAIYSLPQEWLYCETWCDPATKKSAKTIDLCNNPKTKEPKLEAAQRIVPEWRDYDKELRAIWDEFHAGKSAANGQQQQQPKVPDSSSGHTEL
ncbi:hypothetical protein BOX15_Mlig003410g2, partial [Macrostomum lignano]